MNLQINGYFQLTDKKQETPFSITLFIVIWIDNLPTDRLLLGYVISRNIKLYFGAPLQEPSLSPTIYFYTQSTCKQS